MEDFKASDVIKDFRRKRHIPVPECQLGWCIVECVEVEAKDLKTAGGIFMPTGKEEVMRHKASEEQQKGVIRFFVRARSPQFQCNATTIVDTPFEVGDEVLIESGPNTRARTEQHPFVLPERHMAVRIENICAWQKCPTAEPMHKKPEPKA